MKYYKCENGFGKQPNDIIPSFATEITEAEYMELHSAFEARQRKIADYVQKILDGVITLNDVPAEYYDEVYYSLPTEEDPDQDFIDRLISEVNA